MLTHVTCHAYNPCITRGRGSYSPGGSNRSEVLTRIQGDDSVVRADGQKLLHRVVGHAGRTVGKSVGGRLDPKVAIASARKRGKEKETSLNKQYKHAIYARTFITTYGSLETFEAAVAIFLRKQCKKERLNTSQLPRAATRRRIARSFGVLRRLAERHRVTYAKTF